MSEQESLSERELADVLAASVYSKEPRSVSEALAAADAQQPEETEPVEPEPAPEEPPVVVTDEPAQPEPPQPQEPQEPQEAAEPEAPEEEGVPEEPEVEDVHVAWATKRYGDDPARWARAAHEQEQHIGRLSAEKKEAETLAEQWYEYAQSVEAQPSVEMPLTAQEEAWADQAMQNPVQYAYQAVLNGNLGLYNAIIERVAYQDPRQASAVETEVRLQVIAAAEAEAQNGQPPDLTTTLGAAVQRAGIDVATYGEAMMEKITELGELHPYVQTILEGDDQAREIALMAVHDMVRSGTLTTRKVRDESREAAIQREAELRRQAAGVVTGGTSANAQPKKPAFMQAMEDEWKARGQWSEE